MKRLTYIILTIGCVFFLGAERNAIASYFTYELLLENRTDITSDAQAYRWTGNLTSGPSSVWRQLKLEVHVKGDYDLQTENIMFLINGINVLQFKYPEAAGLWSEYSDQIPINEPAQDSGIITYWEEVTPYRDYYIEAETLNLTAGLVEGVDRDGLNKTAYFDEIHTMEWINSSYVDNYPQSGGQDFVEFSLSARVEHEGPLPQTPVPEPNTLILLGLGCLSLAGYSRKCKG